MQVPLTYQLKNVPEGRIPLPTEPMDTWMIDVIIFKKELKFKGRKISAAFNIMDVYSNLLISYLVPNQTEAVINCLKNILTKMKMPFHIKLLVTTHRLFVRTQKLCTS
jgi:hypothetical protein